MLPKEPKKGLFEPSTFLPVLFFFCRDWWAHTADHPGCFWHRSVCWVDPTKGQARSDHPTLRPGWRRGAANHLPPPADTQPVLPAGKQRGCERVQACVRAREPNESSCSLLDSVTLTRCVSSPLMWRWGSQSSWQDPFVLPQEVVCSVCVCEACMFILIAGTCFVPVCMLWLGDVQP